MLSKKHLLITLAVVMLAIAAFSVSSAFAAGSNQGHDLDHAPECFRIESFAPGVWGLECRDAGKDIINAAVKTNAKYELKWNNESVILYVYPDGRGSVAYWTVADKNGSVVSGSLH